MLVTGEDDLLFGEHRLPQNSDVSRSEYLSKIFH